MYNYDNLLEKLKVGNNIESRKKVKAIIHALIKNGDAIFVKQAIDTDYQKVEYLYEILNKLERFFDYHYNSKIDLTKFLCSILNDNALNIDAIFCPGYTNNGYKNYVGNNNTLRLMTLYQLASKLEEMEIDAHFNIMLANIFLENTNILVNPNWKEELVEHEKKFIELANKYFKRDEIMKMSNIYEGDDYQYGFVDEKLCHGKVYDSFLKNNIVFYRKLGWSYEQIRNRIDKLYTIYSITSNYINNQENGIYLPMETMYSRSKVMTKNDVCTMYLRKK